MKENPSQRLRVRNGMIWSGKAKFQVQVSQQEEILWATCSSSIF